MSGLRGLLAALLLATPLLLPKPARAQEPEPAPKTEAAPAEPAAGAEADAEAAPTGEANAEAAPTGEADAEAPSPPRRFLLIQGADEVVLSGRRLELRGVSRATVYVGLAGASAQGQVPTVSFVSRWSEVSERLPDGAMTGTLSLLDEDEGAVLKLRSPMIKSGNLVYEVEVLAGPSELGGGAGSLFVDVVGGALDPAAIAGSRALLRD